ncbi:hypothetical protein [Pannus brasiliensis]|uniref:hypothetical protein n=1 Tax=Pannus brasiliensis TaxID=1579216 RepID=UPI002FCDA3D2
MQISLIIEALLATFVTLAYNFILSTKIKTRRNFIIFLVVFGGMITLFAYFYHFVIVKSQEESLTIFILLISSNLVSQFVEASLYSRLKIVEKTVMCICSMAFWYGLAFCYYNLTITGSYFLTFAGLPIIAVSGFVLLKRYKLFIPR